MKSSLALLATAAAVGATITSTEWVVEVVTVTVTVDPTDFVQAASPTRTATPEPVTTSSAVPSPSTPEPPASAIVKEPETTTTTTQAPPPTSTSEPEPEPTVVQTPTPEPQPTTTKQPQPTSQPPTQSLAPSGSYQDTVVKYHNAYRQDHSASDLQWDATLADYAAATANKCVFEHDMKQGTADYGQNLASYGATGDLGTMENAVGKAIAQQWYENEVGYYNFYGQADPPPGADFSKFGHFSQLVWKGSQKAGCATVKCPAGTVLQYPSLFTVCNYYPPGNYKGEYGSNVMPSLGLKINVSS